MIIFKKLRGICAETAVQIPFLWVQKKTAQVIARTAQIQEKTEISSPKGSLGLKAYWQYRESGEYNF
ncbi:hypothetical protein [Lysinibacillus sp. CTST325]